MCTLLAEMPAPEWELGIGLADNGSLSVGLKGRVHDLFSGALSASVLAVTLLQYL